MNRETHNNVTIFFSDIVRFTDISRALPPVKVMKMLDRLYLKFDALANKHEIFKVETIGDAWMGVTNRKYHAPLIECCIVLARLFSDLVASLFSTWSVSNTQNETHAKRIAEFAIEAVEAAGKVLIDEDDPEIGDGRAIAQAIGASRPAGNDAKNQSR